jgi:parallel beta-helix repeat protein
MEREENPGLMSRLWPQPLRTMLSAALVVAATTSSKAVELTVCPPGSNPPCDYPTITQAVNSRAYPLTAPVTIKVKPGIYRERVRLNNRDGTAGNPLVIVADGPPGSVAVDGTDAFPWNPVPGFADVWSTEIGPTPWSPPATHVFVDSTRYQYVSDGDLEDLDPGEFTRDEEDADRVYIRTPDGIDPNQHDVGVTNHSATRQRAFYLSNSEHVTVDGFVLSRCSEDGIRIDGTGSRAVTVRNCVIRDNWKRGIHLQEGTDCVIEDNRSYRNGRHGIFVRTTSNSRLTRNRAYQNDYPDVLRGGQNGIKVGEGPGPINVTNVTVEYNIAHDNEDTGIELAWASDILVRGNLSYRNGDHGYDNLETNAATYVGNVAARNDHDGISIEASSRNATIFNCIFTMNGVQAGTLETPGGVREMFVDSTLGFQSDYNVIAGLPAYGNVGAGYNEYYRRLVELRAPAAQSGRVHFLTLQGYQDSTYALDDNSNNGLPVFADSTAGDFRPWWASSAIDGADETVPGWTETDFSGQERHDCAGRPAIGKPAHAHGDIGPLEYSDGMSQVESIAGSYKTVSVGWTALGRYGDASWKPLRYGIYVDGVLKRVRTAQNMQWPGRIVETGIPASPCTTHEVFVRTWAESASATRVDTTRSNTVTVATCCSRWCVDAHGLTSQAPRGEASDLPLELDWSGDNPVRGAGRVIWSVPRAQEGESFDLSAFDVAGRRVMTVASGSARAGSHAAEVDFRAASGARLPSGVLFLRLKVGSEVRAKAVVVTR